SCPLSNCQRLGLLRFVHVLVVAINLQFASHRAPQLAFGQHALDSALDNRLRAPRHQLFVLLFTQSARISSVAAIDLLAGFHAGDLHLGGIDHHHVIASVHKRRVLRVMFARQNVCDLCRQASQRLVRGIDHVPFARDFPRTGESSRHANSPKRDKKGTGRPSATPSERTKYAMKPQAETHRLQKARWTTQTGTCRTIQSIKDNEAARLVSTTRGLTRRPQRPRKGRGDSWESKPGPQFRTQDSFSVKIEPLPS